jgi:hypothetical protein
LDDWQNFFLQGPDSVSKREALSDQRRGGRLGQRLVNIQHCAPVTLGRLKHCRGFSERPEPGGQRFPQGMSRW